MIEPMDSSSQMDAKGGYDLADAAGFQPTERPPQRTVSSSLPSKHGSVIDAVITEEEFNSPTYQKCHQQQDGRVGKAVIVCNFMDHDSRKYAADDCGKLEEALNRVGFVPFEEGKSMLYKNLTKNELTTLYNKVAREVDYRSGNGFTCVLFIVMSFGRSGLITCHPEEGRKDNTMVELKDLQEAFQPQNNKSLALKPKIFIVQTVPQPYTAHDAPDAYMKQETKRIPREADFLTYTSDSYCIVEKENVFVKAVVKTLENLIDDEQKSNIEIQNVLIAINREFKVLRKKRKDLKIPCTTSSLTKRLYLF